MKLAERMKHIRTERGISQETLAEQIHVSRQTISKWENGLAVPSSDNQAQLSRALEVPADALLNGGWEPPETEPVQVPPTGLGRRRLRALAAALILAAGILIGALVFYERVFYERGERPVPQAEMQGEVIDNPIIGGLDILPPE